MTSYFSVKNFDQYQHYKDRNPSWIKLYLKLLDDYEFSALPDSSKWHLIAIWLLAAKHKNRIPIDPAWVASKIGAKAELNLDLLFASGFLLKDQCDTEMLAEPYQSADLEIEREKEDTSSLRSDDAEGVDESDRDDGQSDIWKNPLRWLVKQSGKTEAQCRSIMGKWAKTHGNDKVLEAMRAARSSRDGPIDPVSRIVKCLQEIGDERETPETQAKRSAERVARVVAALRGGSGGGRPD